MMPGRRSTDHGAGCNYSFFFTSPRAAFWFAVETSILGMMGIVLRAGMRWALGAVALSGTFGCSDLNLALSPSSETLATGSWLKIEAKASPVCGHVTPTATTCREAGDAPNIVRVDVDGSFFRVDESLATDHAAMLYALQQGKTEVRVTVRRDGDEDSAVGTYTIVDPDSVAVLARCEGDDVAKPIRSEQPVLAGFPVPLEVRLGHDGDPVLGYGYDRLQASAGEIRIQLQDRTKTSHTFVPPVAPGTVSVESPDATRVLATFRAIGMEELNRPELVLLAPDQPCMVASIGTTALCVRRTYTILTPETCGFYNSPGAIALSGQAGGTVVSSAGAGACRVRVQVEGTALQEDLEFELCALLNDRLNESPRR